MTSNIQCFWAKTNSSTSGEMWHPLILHMVDVAACADAILKREPPNTRERMGALLGLKWEQAHPWLLLLISCHDLGKASPGFQLKWDNAKGLLKNANIPLPRLPDTSINHAFVSQIALEKILIKMGWAEDMAALCADAIGAHHGTRATPSVLDKLSGNRNGVDAKNWSPIWEQFVNHLCNVFQVGNPPNKSDLSGPDFMLLSGLTSFADWIGSNEEWFCFGNIEDCEDISAWLERRQKNAEFALDAIGWNNRIPLLTNYKTFNEAFPKCFPVRPLQESVASTVVEITEPCILLVEAPMGEGKTEAAFYAHLELQRRFGHRGMYIGMPTKATGNAMFIRVSDFLKSFSGKRTVDIQLIHGAIQLNETFQKLRFGQIYDEGENGTLQAGEWFSYKKRALLSEYGVGTIDQALITILPVRHYFVRLWGLANRVVIFDEIHAYDAYTGTLLFHLIKWLHALGSSVILLSATLPPEFRRRLANMLKINIPSQEASYPRLTVFESGCCNQTHFAADTNRRTELLIAPLEPALFEFQSFLSAHLPDNGFAGVIVNTVQRAQDLYKLFGEGNEIEKDDIIIGKQISDGTEIYLFHARFPAQERQKREDAILKIFGKNEDQNGKLKDRTGRRILIATQVAEQSLDLDFDLLVSDLAPIDLILQRAGRIWRHQRKNRPILNPFLGIAGLVGNSPYCFGEPLWWNKVYREDILLRTWQVLKKPEFCDHIILPENIDLLVRDVYEGFTIPSDEEILKRLESAEIEAEGIHSAQQMMAHQAIIGLPDDGSWKDASRFYLYDDDKSGVHHSLKAQTRLGEDSLTVIPIYSSDKFDVSIEPVFTEAKEWLLRAISISRKGIVKRLQSRGIPDGWKKSSLLRNCYPMIFNIDGLWDEDNTVKIDRELGVVYKPKEV
ncbi:MAG: hypothetical protein ACD_79C01434G0009 [uncultured bacterium]|nr:MAG: hypothetical protein ACD_79C01434G0009 [uncultured bacterium]